MNKKMNKLKPYLPPPPSHHAPLHCLPPLLRSQMVHKSLRRHRLRRHPVHHLLQLKRRRIGPRNRLNQIRSGSVHPVANPDPAVSVQWNYRQNNKTSGRKTGSPEAAYNNQRYHADYNYVDQCRLHGRIDRLCK